MRIFHFLLAVLCVLLGGTIPTQAAPTPVMAFGEATFTSDFPNGFITTLQVTPSAPLVQARLTITLDGVTTYSADATLPAHQPNETITLEARWNGLTATRDRCPPWMPLQFWWTVWDSAGNQMNTTPQHHTYTDNRNLRGWTATAGAYVTVYTYGQSADFIQYAVGAADGAVTRLQGVYGWSLPYRPTLVFYNTSSDGDADLSGGPTSPFGAFVVGRAYPGTSGVVMLARSDRAFTLRTLTHEIAHLYQYQIGLRLFDAPHWWIEGDAKAQEPAASVEYALNQTRQVALSRGLPDLGAWDTRSYTNESELNDVLFIGGSFVTFLQQIYGYERKILFYGQWRTSGDFYGSFEAIYGEPLASLTGAWQNWVTNNQSGVIAANQDSYTPQIPAVMLPPIPEGMARVNVYWLNFRVAPDQDSEALSLLSIGQLLLPIGRDEASEWMLVELPDGSQGWLFAEYLDYDADISDLTVSLY